MAGSGSRKTNAILHLVDDQHDIYKIYLCPRNSYEAKYLLLINNRENVGSRHCNDLFFFLLLLNT